MPTVFIVVSVFQFQDCESIGGQHYDALVDMNLTSRSQATNRAGTLKV